MAPKDLGSQKSSGVLVFRSYSNSDESSCDSPLGSVDGLHRFVNVGHFPLKYSAAPIHRAYTDSKLLEESFKKRTRLSSKTFKPQKTRSSLSRATVESMRLSGFSTFNDRRYDLSKRFVGRLMSQKMQIFNAHYITSLKSYFQKLNTSMNCDNSGCLSTQRRLYHHYQKCHPEQLAKLSQVPAESAEICPVMSGRMRAHTMSYHKAENPLYCRPPDTIDVSRPRPSNDEAKIAELKLREQLMEEQQRLEQQRLEQERWEQDLLEQQKMDRDILEREKIELQRQKREFEQQKQEQERRERERREQERREQDRREQERREQERREQERREQERREQERREQERREQERREQERREQERREQERREHERREQERQAESASRGPKKSFSNFQIPYPRLMDSVVRTWLLKVPYPPNSEKSREPLIQTLIQDIVSLEDENDDAVTNEMKLKRTVDEFLDNTGVLYPEQINKDTFKEGLRDNLYRQIKGISDFVRYHAAIGDSAESSSGDRDEGDTRSINRRSYADEPRSSRTSRTSRISKKSFQDYQIPYPRLMDSVVRTWLLKVPYPPDTEVSREPFVNTLVQDIVALEDKNDDAATNELKLKMTIDDFINTTGVLYPEQVNKNTFREGLRDNLYRQIKGISDFVRYHAAVGESTESSSGESFRRPSSNRESIRRSTNRQSFQLEQTERRPSSNRQSFQLEQTEGRPSSNRQSFQPEQTSRRPSSNRQSFQPEPTELEPRPFERRKSVLKNPNAPIDENSPSKNLTIRSDPVLTRRISYADEDFYNPGKMDETVTNTVANTTQNRRQSLREKMITSVLDQLEHPETVEERKVSRNSRKASVAEWLKQRRLRLYGSRTDSLLSDLYNTEMEPKLRGENIKYALMNEFPNSPVNEIQFTPVGNDVFKQYKPQYRTDERPITSNEQYERYFQDRNFPLSKVQQHDLVKFGDFPLGMIGPGGNSKKRRRGVKRQNYKMRSDGSRKSITMEDNKNNKTCRIKGIEFEEDEQQDINERQGPLEVRVSRIRVDRIRSNSFHQNINKFNQLPKQNHRPEQGADTFSEENTRKSTKRYLNSDSSKNMNIDSYGGPEVIKIRRSSRHRDFPKNASSTKRLNNMSPNMSPVPRDKRLSNRNLVGNRKNNESHPSYKFNSPRRNLDGRKICYYETGLLNQQNCSSSQFHPEFGRTSKRSPKNRRNSEFSPEDRRASQYGTESRRSNRHTDENRRVIEFSPKYQNTKMSHYASSPKCSIDKRCILPLSLHDDLMGIEPRKENMIPRTTSASRNYDGVEQLENEEEEVEVRSHFTDELDQDYLPNQYIYESTDESDPYGSIGDAVEEQTCSSQSDIAPTRNNSTLDNRASLKYNRNKTAYSLKPKSFGNTSYLHHRNFKVHTVSSKPKKPTKKNENCGVLSEKNIKTIIMKCFKDFQVFQDNEALSNKKAIDALVTHLQRELTEPNPELSIRALKCKVIFLLKDLNICFDAFGLMKLDLNSFAEDLAIRLISIFKRLESSRSQNWKCSLRRHKLFEKIDYVRIGSKEILRSDLHHDLMLEIKDCLYYTKIGGNRYLREQITEKLIDNIELIRVGFTEKVFNEIKAILETTGLLADFEIYDIAECAIASAKEMISYITNDNYDSNTNGVAKRSLRNNYTVSVFLSESETNPSFSGTGCITANKVSAEESNYTNKLTAVIKNWLTKAPSNFKYIQDDHFIDFTTHELAVNITDYMKLRRPTVNTKKIDLERLIMYHICKWMLKFNITNNIQRAEPYTRVLAKKIADISFLDIVQCGERETNKDTKNFERSLLIEEAISTWLAEQSPDMYQDADENDRKRKVKELVDKIKSKLDTCTEKEMTSDVRHWMKKVIYSKKRKRIDSLSRILMKRIINLSRKNGISYMRAIPEKIQRNSLTLYPTAAENSIPKNVYKNSIVQSYSDVMQHLIISFIENFFEADDLLTKRGYLMALKAELQRLNPLKPEQAQDSAIEHSNNFFAEKFNSELIYVQDVSDWLTEIPIDPYYNTTRNKDRIDFIMNLAEVIAETENERKTDPNKMDCNEGLISIIAEYMSLLPVKFVQNIDYTALVMLLVNKIINRRNEFFLEVPERIRDISDFVDGYIKINGQDDFGDSLRMEAWAFCVNKEIQKLLTVSEAIDESKILSRIQMPEDEFMQIFQLKLDFINQINHCMRKLPMKGNISFEMPYNLALQMTEYVLEHISLEELVGYIENWITELPLDCHQDTKIELVIHQLLNTMENVKEQYTIEQIRRLSLESSLVETNVHTKQSEPFQNQSQRTNSLLPNDPTSASTSTHARSLLENYTNEIDEKVEKKTGNVESGPSKDVADRTQNIVNQNQDSIICAGCGSLGSRQNDNITVASIEVMKNTDIPTNNTGIRQNSTSPLARYTQHSDILMFGPEYSETIQNMQLTYKDNTIPNVISTYAQMDSTRNSDNSITNSIRNRRNTDPRQNKNLGSPDSVPRRQSTNIPFPDTRRYSTDAGIIYDIDGRIANNNFEDFDAGYRRPRKKYINPYLGGWKKSPYLEESSETGDKRPSRILESVESGSRRQRRDFESTDTGGMSREIQKFDTEDRRLSRNPENDESGSRRPSSNVQNFDSGGGRPSRDIQSFDTSDKRPSRNIESVELDSRKPSRDVQNTGAGGWRQSRDIQNYDTSDKRQSRNLENDELGSRRQSRNVQNEDLAGRRQSRDVPNFDTGVRRPSKNPESDELESRRTSRNVQSPDLGSIRQSRDVQSFDKEDRRPSKNVESDDSGSRRLSRNVEAADTGSRRPSRNVEESESGSRRPSRNAPNADTGERKSIKSIQSVESESKRPSRNTDVLDSGSRRQSRNIRSTDTEEKRSIRGQENVEAGSRRPSRLSEGVETGSRKTSRNVEGLDSGSRRQSRNIPSSDTEERRSIRGQENVETGSRRPSRPSEGVETGSRKTSRNVEGLDSGSRKQSRSSDTEERRSIRGQENVEAGSRKPSRPSEGVEAGSRKESKNISSSDTEEKRSIRGQGNVETGSRRPSRLSESVERGSRRASKNIPGDTEEKRSIAGQENVEVGSRRPSRLSESVETGSRRTSKNLEGLDSGSRRQSTNIPSSDTEERRSIRGQENVETGSRRPSRLSESVETGSRRASKNIPSSDITERRSTAGQENFEAGSRRPSRLSESVETGSRRASKNIPSSDTEERRSIRGQENVETGSRRPSRLSEGIETGSRRTSRNVEGLDSGSRRQSRNIPSSDTEERRSIRGQEIVEAGSRRPSRPSEGVETGSRRASKNIPSSDTTERRSTAGQENVEAGSRRPSRPSESVEAGSRRVSKNVSSSDTAERRSIKSVGSSDSGSRRRSRPVETGSRRTSKNVPYTDIAERRSIRSVGSVESGSRRPSRTTESPEGRRQSKGRESVVSGSRRTSKNIQGPDAAERRSIKSVGSVDSGSRKASRTNQSTDPGSRRRSKSADDSGSGSRRQSRQSTASTNRDVRQSQDNKSTGQGARMSKGSADNRLSWSALSQRGFDPIVDPIPIPLTAEERRVSTILQKGAEEGTEYVRRPSVRISRQVDQKFISDLNIRDMDSVHGFYDPQPQSGEKFSSRKPGDVMLAVVEEWSQRIPLPATFPPQEQRAIRDGVAVKVLMKISELNDRMKFIDDNTIYTSSLEKELDKLLNSVPQTEELEKKKNVLKAQLISVIESIKPFIKEEQAGYAYTKNLEDDVTNVMSSLPQPVNMDENLIKNITENIVGNFVKSICEPTEFKETYKNNIREALAQYFDEILELKLDDSDLENELDKLMDLLSRVPRPSPNTLRNVQGQIDMNKEVKNFLSTIIVKEGKNSLEKTLGKELYDMESLGYDDQNVNRMRTTIKRYLLNYNVPVVDDTKIMVFLNNLRDTEDTRAAFEEQDKKLDEILKQWKEQEEPSNKQWEKDAVPNTEFPKVTNVNENNFNTDWNNAGSSQNSPYDQFKKDWNRSDCCQNKPDNQFPIDQYKTGTQNTQAAQLTTDCNKACNIQSRQGAQRPTDGNNAGKMQYTGPSCMDYSKAVNTQYSGHPSYMDSNYPSCMDSSYPSCMDSSYPSHMDSSYPPYINSSSPSCMNSRYPPYRDFSKPAKTESFVRAQETETSKCCPCDPINSATKENVNKKAFPNHWTAKPEIKRKKPEKENIETCHCNDEDIEDYEQAIKANRGPTKSIKKRRKLCFCDKSMNSKLFCSGVEFKPCKKIKRQDSKKDMLSSRLDTSLQIRRRTPSTTSASDCRCKDTRFPTPCRSDNNMLTEYMDKFRPPHLVRENCQIQQCPRKNPNCNCCGVVCKRPSSAILPHLPPFAQGRCCGSRCMQPNINQGVCMTGQNTQSIAGPSSYRKSLGEENYFGLGTNQTQTDSWNRRISNLAPGEKICIPNLAPGERLYLPNIPPCDKICITNPAPGENQDSPLNDTITVTVSRHSNCAAQQSLTNVPSLCYIEVLPRCSPSRNAILNAAAIPMRPICIKRNRSDVACGGCDVLPGLGPRSKKRKSTALSTDDGSSEQEFSFQIYSYSKPPVRDNIDERDG